MVAEKNFCVFFCSALFVFCIDCSRLKYYGNKNCKLIEFFLFAVLVKKLILRA